MPLRICQTHLELDKESLLAGPRFCSRWALTSFSLSSSLKLSLLGANFCFRAFLSKRPTLVFQKHFSQITEKRPVIPLGIGVVGNRRVHIFRASYVNAKRSLVLLTCGPKSDREHNRIPLAVLECTHISRFHGVTPIRDRSFRPGQAPGLALQPFGGFDAMPRPLKGPGRALTRGRVSHPFLERGPVFVPHSVREATSRTVMAASH
jgi:hypothetical protein